MAKDDIIRTADICDAHPDAYQVCEIAFNDYAGRNHFHGRVTKFATHEDNKGIRDILAQGGPKGGKGRVLVVDGRGSRRRALCGGNIAAEAAKHGWAGLVFNGCIRDSHEFAGLDIGVKAVGSTPQRPRHDGIGKTGVTLNFGGIAIRDGDYLYADADGVIVAAKPLHK
ncbi:MAG: ribonuclease E activity regulator RraA [Rhodospirillales bacterium]|nr:ribonuclease E activity regulator RraA [Rhodospirillales bacterium]